MISQSLKLNLIPGGVMPRVNVSQYDADSRTINATLYNGPTLYEIPSGSTVIVQGTKKDNTGFAYNCTCDGSIVTFLIAEQMTVYSGEVEAELRIILNDTTLGTSNFIIFVENAALKDETEISETEIPAIIALAREQEENAAASADDAEAWAVGEINGESVPSTDPRYLNNAKYYAEEAQQSSGGSEEFAQEAEAWARGTIDGTSVPSTADQYQNNSKYYAEDAGNSALAAENNEEQAEAWARGTIDGSAVPSTDPQYQNNAKYYADLSEESADAAAISEQNAKASEDILEFYAGWVVPRFQIVDNKLYMKDDSATNFVVQDNKLYIATA